VIDLNNFKTQIKTIFDAANTTTASTDLSSGLVRRIQRVVKYNPGKLPIQASLYPCVAIHTAAKTIENVTIARTQANGKRKAEIDFTIDGIVWNSAIDSDGDPADDDCESLMENIEEIMRANPTVAGIATWSFPTAVTYHQIRLDEESHMRIGRMNYRATVFY